MISAASRSLSCPARPSGRRGSETVILDGAAHGPYEARGSLEDWQAGVGRLASGHVLPVLAISAALAGPLLHLAGQEGGGVHFHGQSSRGKTTLLQVAASVWGRGGSPGYVRAWRATANGLEGAAASATDTVLVLDEFGQVDGREAGAVLYSLSNGGGKVRAARDGAMREPKSWRVMVLSTGEITVASETDGRSGAQGRARANWCACWIFRPIAALAFSIMPGRTMTRASWPRRSSKRRSRLMALLGLNSCGG